MAPKNLFDLQNLKFGIAPGSRVAHILNGDKGGQELVFGKDKIDYSGYGEVKQTELFNNKGDELNAAFFKSMATSAEYDYQKYKDDKYFANMLFAMKDYLTASTHTAQHNAFNMLQIRMLDAKEHYDAQIEKYKKNAQKYTKEINDLTNKLNVLNGYASTLAPKIVGGLDMKGAANPKVTPDPDKTFMGFSVPGAMLGSWQESSKALFPHEPSPNDIKQGVGLMDCFMMSQLCAIAKEDPEYIKNSMRDNGDGTVTVRFFTDVNKGQKGKEPKYEPEYIRVNKTVNQNLFGNNYYASSSLWVQMMEKAFAEYTRRHLLDTNLEKKNSGMGTINLGSSGDFLEAFKGKRTAAVSFNYGNRADIMVKNLGDGNWKNRGKDWYMPDEKKIFNFLDKCINQDGDSLSCGVSHVSKGTQKELKDLGLRPGHAYSVTNVFEKDGKYFVQLRDPYATFTPVYDDKGNLTYQSDSSTLGDMISGAKNGGRENMGCFNLELRDFLYNFSTVDGVSPENYKLFSQIQRDYLRTSLLELKDEHLASEEAFMNDYLPKNKAIFDEKYKAEELRFKKNRLKDCIKAQTVKSGPKGKANDFDDGVDIYVYVDESKYTNPSDMGEDELREEIEKLATELNVELILDENGNFVDPNAKNIENEMSGKDLDDFGMPEAEEATEETLEDVNAPEENAPEETQEIQEEALDDYAIDKDPFADPAWRLNAHRGDIKLMLLGDDGLGYLAIAEKLRTVYQNLDATSRYFSWMNSSQYNDMFAELKNVNEKFDWYIHGKGDFVRETPATLSALDLESVADQLLKLTDLNDKYLNYKFNEMVGKAAKGNMLNDRSLHRVSGSLSISNILSGGEPITPSKDHKLEAMNIVMNDMEEHIRLLNEGKDVLGPSLEDTQKALDSVNTYLSKNSKIKSEFEKYRTDLKARESKDIVDEFEVINRPEDEEIKIINSIPVK